MAGFSQELPLFPDLPKLRRSTYAGETLENYFRSLGYLRIAGLDEVGRGPLAGPVVAAAVVLPAPIRRASPLRKLKDSKLLQAEQRSSLYEAIVAEALDVAWALCDPVEIDAMNIHAASMEAMKRAALSLDPPPELCLVDGRTPLPCSLLSKAVVKGDLLCRSIAAASVVAKVVRDRIMQNYHAIFPRYNFISNKGYATKDHKKALDQFGPCEIHRRSFAPVHD